jgi:hypothetical protein
MQTLTEQIAGIQDAIAKLELAHKTATTAGKRQITSVLKNYKRTLGMLLKNNT